MKAILIDPHAETIAEVVYDGDWRSIGRWIDADTFDCVYIDNHDTAYVDDEGLFRDRQKFFYINGWPHPLAGKALILGDGEDGNSTDAHTSVDHFRGQVKFMDLQTVQQLSKMGAFE